MSLARQAEETRGVVGWWIKARMALAFNRVKSKADWNAKQLMEAYFHHDAIKTMFTAIVADFTTKPSEFPALGVPAIHLETAFDKRIPAQPGRDSARSGYFYILDGCQSLVNAVIGALTARKAAVVTGTAVEKIVLENGHVKGVELGGGKFEPADLVIASGGAKETFYGLVGKEHLPAKISEMLERNIYMESVLMVHLGIDFDPTPYQPAALCYYYGTHDLEGSIEALRQGHYHEGKEGFLIYVPSMHSPSLAPSGCQAVTIYTLAPNNLLEGNWQDRREELADKLVAEAERKLPGLKEHTQTRAILTPQDFRERTGQQHHSFGGTPPIIGNQSPAHRTPIQGLWFVGAQSESGGGVMNVMLGARKAVCQILG
jgi:phytoene dehydrogenase-like protein